jgi:hypothetical protein
VISYFADFDLVPKLLEFQHRRESGEPVRIWLAEGDSWFSIGGATGSLLHALDGPNTLIVSCAYPGDTIRNMSRLGNEPLGMMLDPHFGWEWDAVLLSAGGNDLLADIGCIISHRRVDHGLAADVLDGIERGYRQIVATIRQHHRCPIHAHTYDYPVSDSRGGFLRLGPWVGNRLLDCGIPTVRHDAIITSLIDWLAMRLYRIEGITLHDTRGTLTPGKWRPIGWQKHYRNEIHPTVLGYRLLAARWAIP